MVYMTRSDTMRGRYRGDPGGRERSGEAALALANNARSSAERLLCFRLRSPRPSRPTEMTAASRHHVHIYTISLSQKCRRRTSRVSGSRITRNYRISMWCVFVGPS